MQQSRSAGGIHHAGVLPTAFLGRIHRGMPMKQAPVLGALLTISLAGLLPLWIVSLTNLPARDSWTWAFLAAAIAGVRLAWVVASAERRLFEVTTWVYFYVFLGLAPLVQIRTGFDPLTTPSVDHAFDRAALGIVIVSEIALLVGSLSAARSPVGPSQSVRVVDIRRTMIVTYILLAAAIAYIAIVGLVTIFDSRLLRARAIDEIIPNEVVGNIVAGFVSFGLLVAVVAQLAARRGNTMGKKPPGLWVLAASTLLLFIITNPLGSPRIVFMTVVLGYLAALGTYRSAAAYRALTVGSVVGMLFLFPVLDTFKWSKTASVEWRGAISALQEGDFDSFAQVVNTAWFVDSEGHTWGEQFLGVLLFWVPRDLWPEKPLDTGIVLAEARGYVETGLSAPLPAELYIDTGWIAVAVSMFAAGYLFRRWDRRSNANILANGVPTVLGCVAPFFLYLPLRGSLLTATASLAVIVATWLLVTRRQHLAHTVDAHAHTKGGAKK